jgi:tRNA wybutosine-synthesizing protein 3
MAFDLDKKNILGKIDKSKKGEIDEGIQEIVNTINSKENYYTTSSCAGRIVLQTGESKFEVKWLKVSHEPVDLNWAKTTQLPKETVWFRMEPVILHVACKDIEKAQELLDKIQPVFKRTFIQTTKNKIMVEIKGNEFVEAPVAKDGKWLVSDEYLLVLTEESNKKLAKTREKTELLKMAL